MALIFIFVAIIITGFFIWWNRKIAKVNRTLGEKRQKEYLKAEEEGRLRAEEEIREQEEGRKYRAEVDEMESKVKEERDIKEKALRRKIEDAKKDTAEGEKRKIEGS